jgi:hypothetical protein
VKNELKKLQEELDLKKSMKIHKPIFRIALFSILSLFVLCLLTDGIGVMFGSQYLKCPSDNVNPCENPFYTTDCDDDFNCVEELQPGEVLGDRPSFLSRNFGFISLAIVLCAWLLNFAYFKQKKGD